MRPRARPCTRCWPAAWRRRWWPPSSPGWWHEGSARTSSAWPARPTASMAAARRRTFRSCTAAAKCTASQALRGSIAQLRSANEAMERQVRERTLQLQQANAELEHQARSDPLTGLLNRRGFDFQLDFAMALARRSGRPLSVLVIDVDHFKRINDQHGHDMGDAVLRTLARAFRMRLRESDVLARMGARNSWPCCPTPRPTRPWPLQSNCANCWPPRPWPTASPSPPAWAWPAARHHGHGRRHAAPWRRSAVRGQGRRPQQRAAAALRRPRAAFCPSACRLPQNTSAGKTSH